MMELPLKSESSEQINIISINKNDTEDGEIIEDSITNITNQEERKLLRAKRFGPVTNSSMCKSQDPSLQNLYRRMKVTKDTRLEALHLHGTDNMKTDDVFLFFSGYSPVSIEWLTDKTCNVAWLDNESCAKALKNCSIRISGQYSEESDGSDEEHINREDIRCALPPGGIWRRGHASQLAPNLFVRFATYTDRRGNKPTHHLFHNDSVGKGFVFLDEGDEGSKKFRRDDSGNPWSDIAREWSFFELKSAAKKQDKRLPIRDARELLSKEERDSSEGRLCDELINVDRKTIPGDIISGRKMQADIEEKKILSKIKKCRSKQLPSSIDLRQRLSSKRLASRYNFESISEESMSEEEQYVTSSRKRMADIKWSRGESEESDYEDERHFPRGTEDLRSKLRKNIPPNNGKTKKISSVLTKTSKKFIPDCPLQIEIDNDIYYQGLDNDK